MEVTLTVRKLDEGAGAAESVPSWAWKTRFDAVASGGLTVLCEVLQRIDNEIDQFANSHGREPAFAARSPNALINEVARKRMDSVGDDFVCCREMWACDLNGYRAAA